MDYVAQLKQLPKKHDYFIGFDSDGCVFDTMEIKHKECFCPAYIKHLGLQPVSKAAREVWDFVNLYSKTRGCNRFFAIQHARDLLRERKDVQARGFKVPELKELDAWVKRETKLGNPALKQEVEKTGNQELKTMLAWSAEVNARVTDMVFGMSPFPRVMDVLKQGQKKADMIVVSQTPLEALAREWEEHKMDIYVGMIAGQEYIAGTNPTNAASYLKAAQTNRNVVTWSPVTGRTYSVYWSTNLVKGFTALSTNIVYPQGSYTNATPDSRINNYQVKVRLTNP